jgi:hypothetical protein
MQYTIRNVSKQVDTALRKHAKRRGKSLNQLALDALAKEAGLGEPTRYRDLSWLAGSWVQDPEFDKAIEDQRRIDPDLWK